MDGLGEQLRGGRVMGIVRGNRWVARVFLVWDYV